MTPWTVDPMALLVPEWSVLTVLWLVSVLAIACVAWWQRRKVHKP